MKKTEISAQHEFLNGHPWLYLHSLSHSLTSEDCFNPLDPQIPRFRVVCHKNLFFRNKLVRENDVQNVRNIHNEKRYAGNNHRNARSSGVLVHSPHDCMQDNKLQDQNKAKECVIIHHVISTYDVEQQSNHA